MKRIIKCGFVWICALFLLCACSKQAKYEPLDIEAVVGQEEAETLAPTPEYPSEVYVRVPVNLIHEPGESAIGAFVDRGTKLEVYDYAEGMYQVAIGSNMGWIGEWYVVETAEESERPEIPEADDEGNIAPELMPATGSDAYYLTINSLRGNVYGGGTGADPDYYARDKEFVPNNQMPDRVKALYLNSSFGKENFEDFIEVAKTSGINAFVINICDNQQIGYPSEVMKDFCPSAYKRAGNSREEYATKIQRLKDEGFFVIGRMTTFQDDYLAKDHPELTICDNEGNPRPLSNGYWPTPYQREVWQYKIDVAKEAVEWFGFDEIQFDYVRFPDRTQSAEKEGNIDYRNENNETKVQAIQRFLMYAVDQLHPMGVYVGADVFGEVSLPFVGGYGQYWPAISNVVDVISGMPYTDHYEATEDWIPWEHPYETVKQFADQAVARQAECPTPAIVRTWIQGYNAYKEPHTEFYAENVGKEIKALYDAGLTGGYMIWNGANDIEHAQKQKSAFDIEP